MIGKSISDEVGHLRHLVIFRLLVLVGLWSVLHPLMAQDLRVVPRDGAPRDGALPAAANQWYAASRSGEAPPTACDGAVLLRNGALLVGIPVSISKDQVVMRSDRFGLVHLPVATVSALAFGATVRAIGAGEPGAVFANGDAMPGKIAFLDELNLGLDTGRRILTIPRSRVSIVRLAPLEAAPSGWRVLADNGDRLLGTLTVRGRAQMLDAGVGSMDLAKGGWSAAWWEGEDCRPATTLPFLGATPSVAIDAFHDGRPLSWRNRVYGRGLAIRGGARLEWARPPGSRLVGEAVLLAGEQATVTIGEHTVTLAAGAPPQPFSVAQGDGPCVVTVSAPPATGSPLVVIGWPLFVR